MVGPGEMMRQSATRGLEVRERAMQFTIHCSCSSTFETQKSHGKRLEVRHSPIHTRTRLALAILIATRYLQVRPFAKRFKGAPSHGI